jgi:hypothetical protein
MKKAVLNVTREQIMVPLPLQDDRSCQELRVCKSVLSPPEVVYFHRATRVKPEISLVVRGELPASDWPRQYKAESLDISLHLSHSSSRNTLLLGILTSTNPLLTLEGMDAELYTAPGPYAAEGDQQREKPLLRTPVDDLGHIVFSDVPEGEYVMILHLPGLDVVIEDISIKMLC